MSPKIIFLATTGNKLHGIDVNNSLESFVSVFIPSQEQLLGLSGYEQEYYKESTYFISLPRFLKKVSEDNLHAIEILFTPKNYIKYSETEWDLVSERAKNCLGRSVASKFFNEAQRLTETLPSTEETTEAFQIARIINNLPTEVLNLPLNSICSEDQSGNLKLDKYILSTFLNEADEQMVAIGGKQYLSTTRVRTIRDKMRSVEIRGIVTNTTDSSYDFGALATAVRYIDQGNQFLQNNTVVLPSPQKDFLNLIMSGKIIESDPNWIQTIKNKVKQTPLNVRKKDRLETDKALLSELSIATLKAHINSSN